MISGSIIESVYIDKTFEVFIQQLEIIEKQEKYSLDDLNRLLAWWMKKSEIMELTIPHTQLNDITVTYNEMIGAVSADDQPSATAVMVRLKSYAERINHTYKFLPNNII